MFVWEKLSKVSSMADLDLGRYFSFGIKRKLNNITGYYLWICLHTLNNMNKSKVCKLQITK